ncbi:MAG TPA: D-glycero-beta-D-manno-heptose-7-phosphate kinase [Bacteroidetes bacterium]|nr:D-glycero-beta-D-manno-heptose-7-phosphate kinase [Bacteroidota bacterium]
MNKWEALFSRFGTVKALVVGDMMVDSYLFGKVDRISPEAPVPIVTVEKRDYRPGGAANVALNLRALGAEVAIASIIGNDEQGDRLNELLLAEGIATDGLIRSAHRKTTVKHRIIGNNHHMLRVDDEDLHELNLEERKDLLDWIELELEKYQVLIFEDYDKGLLNESLIQAIIFLAKSRGIVTVVDPKRNNFLAYRGATLFKPNLKEIIEGLKLDSNLKNETELKHAVELVQSRLHCDIVMVTLSERGVLISDRKHWERLPAHVRNISDVSGAGDTVVSVAALCLALNAPLFEIAFLSNLAGGLVCEKVGVVPIEKAKLLEEAIKLSRD